VPGLIHLVDDDQSFRTAMERRLKQAGYNVATYASAQQLLDRLPSDNEPSCIILDVQMSGLDGPALQKRLGELGLTLLINFSHWPWRHSDHRTDAEVGRARLPHQAGRRRTTSRH
jgi:FixJ family two-component response regulator